MYGIRNVTLGLATCTAGILIGAGLLTAVPASAAGLPSCATAVNCTDTDNPPAIGGTAGYYGANDNHTHYRYVQTVTTATPQLFELNTDGPGAAVAAIGVRLCDPNTGYSAEAGIVETSATTAELLYASGYSADGADPCVHNGPLVADPILPPNVGANCGLSIANNQSNIPGVDTCGAFNIPVNTGDSIFLAAYYNPGHGKDFHHISFGACDITQSVCRQAWSRNAESQSFWEFGIGAFTPRAGTTFTAPANNPLAPFSQNAVTCYGCAHAVDITQVSPVNPFNIGGLYEAQMRNASKQVVFSADDSLNVFGLDAFQVSNGSTSG